MTDANKKLVNLEDAMVEDILNMSDEEIWQEFVEECGSQEAAKARMRRINIAFGELVAKAKQRELKQYDK